MALSTYGPCIVFGRIIKIPEYCVVNIVCIENKVKPEI